MKKFFLNWFPVIACCWIIYYLSSRPVSSPVEFEHIDKIVHIIFYAFLAFLAARAVEVSQRGKKIKLSLILIIFVSMYGIFIEWYQSYIPTRTSSVADGIANFVGALLGVIVYAAYHGLKKERV